MKKTVITLLTILLCFFLASFAVKQIRIHKAIAEMPDLEMLSEVSYEPNIMPFGDVKSAVLISGGKTTEIATDDPRLTVTLRFLAYSRETQNDWMLYAILFQDDIDQVYAKKCDKLEITFDTGSNCDKILICEDFYITIHNQSNVAHTEDGQLYSGPDASLMYPYGNCAYNAHVKFGKNKSSWFDLLSYLGF